MKQPLMPAARVVAKFGGVSALARTLQVRHSTVLRWTYRTEDGGTGGVIPTKRQHQLLALAERQGVSLAPADFFETAA